MKKDIKISEVLQCLEDGMSRKEIAEHFDITMVDCKRMFKDPLLKGKKAKKQAQFNLVDDVSDEKEVNAETLPETFSPMDTNGETIINPNVEVPEEKTAISEEPSSNIPSDWNN